MLGLFKKKTSLLEEIVKDSGTSLAEGLLNVGLARGKLEALGAWAIFSKTLIFCIKNNFMVDESIEAAAVEVSSHLNGRLGNGDLVYDATMYFCEYTNLNFLIADAIAADFKK